MGRRAGSRYGLRHLSWNQSCCCCCLHSSGVDRSNKMMVLVKQTKVDARG